MPGHSATFLLTDAEVTVREADGTFVEPAVDVDDVLEVVKVAGCAFLSPEGSDDVWIELAVANRHDEPVRVDSLTVGFRAPGPEPTPAPTRFPRETVDLDYLWNERSGDWETMYDDFATFGGDHPYVADDGTAAGEDDRVFRHALGSGDRRQCLVSTPVYFEHLNNRGVRSENRDVWRLSGFRTMATGRPPVLLPSAEVEDRCPDVDDAEVLDCVNLWVMCEEDNLTGGGSIEKDFNFTVDSEVGPIRNTYVYYILPPGAEFDGSNSEYRVGEHNPPRVHWLFDEWKRRYDVEKSEPESGDVGESVVLKSKARNTDYVHNRGTFEIVGRRRATEFFHAAALVVAPSLLAAVLSLLTATFVTGEAVLGTPALAATLVVLGAAVAAVMYYLYRASKGEFVLPARVLHGLVEAVG